MKFRTWFTLALVWLFCVGSFTPMNADAQSRSVVKKSIRKKKKRKPVLKKVIVPVKKVVASVAPVVGTWFTIDTEGKFARANKFLFTKFGEFTYIGPGFKSSGSMSFKEGVMNLTWLSIDGQPVKPGTIKRAISVTSQKIFKIDRFTYKWAL